MNKYSIEELSNEELQDIVNGGALAPDYYRAALELERRAFKKAVWMLPMIGITFAVIVMALIEKASQ